MEVLRNVLLNWVLPVLVVVLCLVGWQWFAKPEVQLGERGEVPEFSLQDTEGQWVSLAEFRGQKVLLNFWESWCGPCKAELPGINRFARKHPEVIVLGIASQSGDFLELAAAKEDLGIEFRVLRGTEEIRRAYGVRKVPTTFLVGQDGQLEESHVGVITPVTLGAWLR
ncbi:MAG: TlpA disulfide reductase family protein [Myxococcota bacterium]|nr:TlpA disulfide reductase family protein [Myxococcota bacterium]